MLRNASFPKVLCAVPVALLVGCGYCPTKEGPEPPDPPEVLDVIVRPGTILAAPGSEFTLDAVAKGKWGVQLKLGSSTGLSIEWDDPDGMLADATTNPVTVTTPSTVGTSATLRATVSSSNGSPVTSDPVTIRVSPIKGSALAVEADTDKGISDWVNAEHTAKSPPAALLVQASENGSSVADWDVGVVGHVRLEHNFSRASGGDPSEAAILARGRYMELQPRMSVPQPWSTAADNVPADPMGSNGGRYLSVRVGVEDLGADVEGIPVTDWVEQAVVDAFGLLNRARAGLELDFVDVYKHDLTDTAGNPIPAEPDAHCGVPETLVPTWATDVNVLHVLYAPDILFWPTDTSSVPDRRTGWACTPSVTPGDNRLVFISWKEAFPATVAHELGHVLALTTGTGSGATGHVNGLGSEFDNANIMWDGSGIVYGGARTHLTLGQLYRINAHPTSWLNIVSPSSLQLARSCTSTLWGTCPALAADLGG